MLLIDRDKIVVSVWEWLQQASASDIERLPVLKAGDLVPDDIPIEAQWFLGWMYNAGSERSRNVAGNYHGRFTVKFWTVWRLLKTHWTIRHGNYWESPNVVATWFIDPPYQSRGAGNRYRHSAVDYDHLREWTLARKGQVIACDGESATWLPFTRLTREVGQRSQLTDRWEMMWHRRTHRDYES